MSTKHPGQPGDGTFEDQGGEGDSILHGVREGRDVGQLLANIPLSLDSGPTPLPRVVLPPKRSEAEELDHELLQRPLLVRLEHHLFSRSELQLRVNRTRPGCRTRHWCASARTTEPTPASSDRAFVRCPTHHLSRPSAIRSVAPNE